MAGSESFLNHTARTNRDQQLSSFSGVKFVNNLNSQSDHSKPPNSLAVPTPSQLQQMDGRLLKSEEETL